MERQRPLSVASDESTRSESVKSKSDIPNLAHACALHGIAGERTVRDTSMKDVTRGYCNLYQNKSQCLQNSRTLSDPDLRIAQLTNSVM